MEKCIGCELCAGVCPADCIYVRGADNPPDQPVSPGERFGFVYEINYLRCIHCDLCVEACPTEAITETKMFEFSFTNRADAIYTKTSSSSTTTAVPNPPLGGLASGGRPAHFCMDARDVAQRFCAVRRQGPVGGRAGIRRARARRGTVGRARRRRNRDKAASRHHGAAPGRRGEASRPTGHRRDHGQDAQEGGCAEELVAPTEEARKMTGLSPVLAQILAAAPSGRAHVRVGGGSDPRRRTRSGGGRNPVHSALMLVMTLFGVAVIFIELQANFLAAVQVIVYAGAIVVLFLFVIMLLGVDKQENLETDPLWGQRPVALALVVLALAGVLALGIEAHWAVGAHAVAGARNPDGGDVAALGRSVFTTYLFPFEVTSALLVIAVVGRSSFAQAEDAGVAFPVALEPGPEQSGSAVGDGQEPAETEPAETEPVETEPVEKKPVLRSAGATQARDEEART